MQRHLNKKGAFINIQLKRKVTAQRLYRIVFFQFYLLSIFSFTYSFFSFFSFFLSPHSTCYDKMKNGLCTYVIYQGMILQYLCVQLAVLTVLSKRFLFSTKCVLGSYLQLTEQQHERKSKKKRNQHSNKSTAT